MSKKDLFWFDLFSFVFVFIFVSGILHWLNYWLKLNIVQFLESASIVSVLYGIAVSIYLIKKGKNK